MEYLESFEKYITEVGKFCNDIKAFIEFHLDINLAKDIEILKGFDTNFINTNVDTELDKKSNLLKESELKMQSIKAYFSSLIESKDKNKKTVCEFVKIHETEKNNIGLICTSRRCKLLVECLPKDPSIVSLEYVTENNTKKFEFKISKTQFTFEKQSASNNFITDEQINELCKNVSTIKNSIKDLVGLVYNRFVSKFETYQKEFEIIIQFITYIDLLYTKATIAKKYNYCKPVIVESDKSFVNASNLRHCLIEQFQNNEIYVTNDITLGDGKIDGMLLYGTNAVGKTSFIKSIGIAIIMAQSGLYVPASLFEFYPYKYIFTRIIGNDNIFKGLSTFAVEMSELRTILRLADENSLILGDELCSGTEITSAISIFVAGIQKLHSCKSSFIFATHLHEIVNYEEITSLNSIVLKHMEVIYDKERELLIYDRKLKDGPGNSMYGLEVCKSLNLPQEFLDAAYEIRFKYQKEISSILSLKTSSYNSKKIINMCENCKIKEGKEVHHLNYQKDADENGIITTTDSVFHKNNLANLMTLCEMCHNDIHKNNKKIKKVKTSKGTLLREV
jgi:DNA mismatch repair protein MutS